MLSHTVPKKLLEQFAYFNPFKRSLWLWRYEKDRAPYPNASPRSATQVPNHFSHPDDSSKEAEIERRLGREFESPVNDFLFEITRPGFSATDVQRRQLTLYVTLLFLRSEARRKASAHTQEVIRKSIDNFLSNESQLLTVVAKWNIELILSGETRRALFTVDDLIGMARKARNDTTLEIQARRSYVTLIENGMRTLDERLMAGEWKFLRTTPDKPFVISDAPVATWERRDDGLLYFGTGFHRENVEVTLPVSSLLCLHILPDVKRTRQVVPPSVDGINIAQAAFASRHCFTNVNDRALDRLLQPSFGLAELGKRSFTIWHRNFDDTYYEMLMNDGRFVQPPQP
jgi:hypothetical protein